MPPAHLSVCCRTHLSAPRGTPAWPSSLYRWQPLHLLSLLAVGSIKSLPGGGGVEEASWQNTPWLPPRSWGQQYFLNQRISETHPPLRDADLAFTVLGMRAGAGDGKSTDSGVAGESWVAWVSRMDGQEWWHVTWVAIVSVLQRELLQVASVQHEQKLWSLRRWEPTWLCGDWSGPRVARRQANPSRPSLERTIKHKESLTLYST